MYSSAQLNKCVRWIVDQKEYAPEGESKCIPYIGERWRDIDFDAKTIKFAVIKEEGYEKPFVGFLTNPECDFWSTRETTPGEWANIKALIVAAVNKPSVRAFGLVHEAIYEIYDLITKSEFSGDIELEL